MADQKSPRYLTKSRFTLALQCPTKLYYGDESRSTKYPSRMNDDEFLKGLAEGGYQVGELAKLYHPDGHQVMNLAHQAALDETAILLQQENVTIFEAAVRFENFFIRIDILKKRGNKVELIEVKSKSFDPEDPDILNKSGFISSGWRPYIYDVSFQTWVTREAFPEWKVEPYLMLADKSSEASIEGLNQLFKTKRSGDRNLTVTVAEHIKEKSQLGDEILIRVPVRNYMEMVLAGTDRKHSDEDTEDNRDFILRAQDYSDHYQRDVRYPIQLGVKCKKCEFQLNNNENNSGLRSGFNECWMEVYGDAFDPSEPHIFELWNFRGSKDLLEQGIYRMRDINPLEVFMEKKRGELVSKGKVADRQYLQYEKTIEDPDGKEQIDPRIYSEIDSWTFPLHFIDFETSMVALPFNKGRRPYEQTAFQFSNHTLHRDGHIEHDEWINTDVGEFPNFKFVAALKTSLSKDEGTIFRYAHHENTVLRQIHAQLERS